MTIASFHFLGFASIVAAFYWAARPVWWRQGVLLVANILFLATFAVGGASYVPFVAFLFAGYVGTLIVQNARNRAFFMPILVAIIAAFFWLKKYSFVPSNLFLDIPYVTIGLSYLFFRMLHVLIDAGAGDLPDRIGLVPYFNYLTNFTSLVSGPIQRYGDYSRTQLATERPRLDWCSAGVVFERIIIGFFKVIVLAALLSTVHERTLAGLSENETIIERVATVLSITVSYTFYLYCNFSGYTDIVIGVARFVGLDLPENFNRPFSAPSFIEFWGRWHMTLSNWLRTYVYNPLVKALMRRFPSPSAENFLGVFAFFVTFFLIGLWHGQTSKFAVYGLFLGLGVSGNKLYQIAMAKQLGRKKYRALVAKPLYHALACGLTFTWFTLSLLFFWASWEQIGDIMRLLGTIGMGLLALSMFAVASMLLPLFEIGPWFKELVVFRGIAVFSSRYFRTVWATAIATVSVGALLLMATPAPDIIYKNF